MTITSSRPLGTIVGIWGHPDDEAYLSAGLMAQAMGHDQRVVCVTATRGEAGFPELEATPVGERAAIREREMAACLRTLDVTEHRWLDYLDGRCDEADEAVAVDTLTELLLEVQPDTVLTFGPDGMTGHVDHIAVSRWTTFAFRRAALDGARLFYATQTRAWNDRFMNLVNPGEIMMVDGLEPPTTPEDELAIWFRLDDELVDRKVAALLCQSSQVGALAAQVGADDFREMSRDEFFRSPTPTDWA